MQTEPRSLGRRSEEALLVRMADMCCLRYSNPVIPLAVLPLSLPLRLIFQVEEHPVAMHQIVPELTNVFVPIGLYLGAFSVHFSLFKLPLVPASIWPRHDALTLHIIVFKFTFIQFGCVCEVVLSVPMKLTVDEITFVEAALELEAALARLFAFKEISGVFNSVKIPAFGAVAMLLVVEPLSCKHASVSVHKDAVAIGLAVEPGTLVDVSVNVRHPSLAIVEPIPSLPLIKTPVAKLDSAKTFPNIHIRRPPLPLVELDRWLAILTD